MTRIFLVLLTAFLPLIAADAAWKVEVKPPAKLKANYEMPFEVSLSDSKGAPVAGAQVEVVLTMVDMDHGEFKSGAKQVKPGTYATNPKFIMVGDWNLEVRAKKGGQSLVKKFRYTVNE